MAWVKLVAMAGVFALSLIASTFPTLSKRFYFLRVPHTLFFVLKHFGTGVILSTAFVHLLQDAFKILLGLPEGNPIRQWVGLIVLTALLAIFLIEYISMAYVERLEEKVKSGHEEEEEETYEPYRHSSPETSDCEADEVVPKPNAPPNGTILPPLAENADYLVVCKTNPPVRRTESASERTALLRAVSTPSGTKAPHHISVGHQHHYSAVCSNPKDGPSCGNQFAFLQRKMHHHQEELYTSNGRCEVGSGADGWQDDIENENEALGHDSVSMDRKHAIVSTLVLQAGIMIHSLVIGLTLSIKSGPEFTSLVIAILFHQLFEGISLGVRLAGLGPSSQRSSSLSIPLVLATIFAAAVPAGCLIGRLTLGADSSSPYSALPLTQGLTSALSAGTLIYASGVELLAGDFLHSSLRQSSIGRQALALTSLLAGVAGMAGLA